MAPQEEFEILKQFVLGSSKFLSEFEGMVGFHQTALDSVERLSSISLSERISGFRQAANDVVDMTMEFPSGKVRLMDQYLEKEGSKSLSFFRSRNRKLIGRILRKKSDLNEDEYYALKNYRESEWEKMGESDLEKVDGKLRAFEAGNERS